MLPAARTTAVGRGAAAAVARLGAPGAAVAVRADGEATAPGENPARTPSTTATPPLICIACTGAPPSAKSRVRNGPNGGPRQDRPPSDPTPHPGPQQGALRQERS